jgi:hypothetical protein
MKLPSFLDITLLSDATFGGGTGVAGEVDLEIDHDELGLPRICGKSIRGLLKDTFTSMAEAFQIVPESAAKIFGVEGALLSPCILHIADARVEESVRSWIAYALSINRNISPRDVLHSLTDIRYQTAEERTTGAPARHSLRSSRVIAAGLTLRACLSWQGAEDAESLRYLAMAALGTRHAGVARNRGRGLVTILLDGNSEWTRSLAGGLR